MRPITGDASCQNYLSLLVAAPRGESCSAPPGATGAIAVVNDGTVISRSKRRERAEATVTRLRPISTWLLILAVVVIVAVTGPLTAWLYGIAGDDPARRFEAIKIGLNMAAATGGAFALLLAFRRQRSTELTLVHTDRDATERRITELYTKAADQLGSDQAPVRLAGLYALERLAHSTAEHRQTIVDVICAYLRMPYTPPPPQQSYRSPRPARRRRVRMLTDGSPHNTTPTSRGSRQEQAQQEQQVRLTAQNILLRNLRVAAQRRRWRHRTPPSAIPSWPSIRLDLTGALLLEFSLAECQFDYAAFTRAQFTGEAHFEDAQFTGRAYFGGARFTGEAYFGGARVASAAEPASIWPPGWTTRHAKPDNGEDPAFLYLARMEDSNPPDT